MTDTTFVDKTLPVVNAAWLNDVNISVYRAIGAGGIAPATAVDVITNIGAATPASAAAASAAVFAASTGAAGVGSIQSGTGAVLRTLQADLRDTIKPQQFGAVGDDTTDDIAAFNAATVAAAASGKVIVIPAGTYKLGSSWTLGAGTFPFKVISLGTVTLHFTGAGQGLILDGSLYLGNLYGAVFGGDRPIKLKGNAATTDICFIRSIHHSNINLDAKNGATGFRINFAVCTVFRLECSNNTDGGFTTTPVNGIVTGLRGAGEYVADCIFENPVIEGVSGTGIVNVNSGFCVFRKGTSEGNNKGITFDATTFGNIVDGIDCEVNAVSDIEDFGLSNVFRGVTLQSFATNPHNVIVGSTASGTKFEGGSLREVNLDAASILTSFAGCTFSDNAGLGITGTGSIASRVGCVRANTSSVVTAKYADLVGENGLTWTPVLTSTGGGTQGTVTRAIGTYCRVGKMNFIEGNVSIAKGTLGAGTLSISGLPTLSRNTSNANQFIPVGTWDNVTLGAGYTHLALQLLPNSANITPIKCGTAVASVGAAVADFPDPVILGFSGSYETI